MANFGGKGNGHERDVKRDPNGTLTAGGQHALVQPPDAFLDSYYSARDLQRHPDEPAATLTGVDRHALVQRPGFLARAGGTRRNDVQDSMDPRNTVLPGEDYGVAAPAQQTPEAVEDFGFRMLARRRTSASRTCTCACARSPGAAMRSAPWTSWAPTGTGPRWPATGSRGA